MPAASLHALRVCRDRKKKKYVGESGDKKMIKTESGNKIPASFRSHRYDDWSAKNHADR